MTTFLVFFSPIPSTTTEKPWVLRKVVEKPKGNLPFPPQYNPPNPFLSLQKQNPQSKYHISDKKNHILIELSEGGVGMVGGKKRWFFKRLRKESLRWKFLWPAFKLKRLTLPVSFVNDVVFKVVSAFEAIVLVLTVCFFYLCCGCSFWFFSLISPLSLCFSFSCNVTSNYFLRFCNFPLI